MRAKPPASRDASIPRVLIVDDDAIQRALARNAIERFGMRAEEAENGEAGLRAFELGQHDMVLLDVIMPGLDGFDVCTRLRKVAQTATTPILMMTGLNDNESIERAYACGASDFITKPINPLILGHRLRYMLRTGQVSAALARSEAQFEETRNQLLQSEKMASIGQLAAGVAHEINNPIGYVNSNLGSLETYLKQLFAMIDTYERAETAISDVAVLADIATAKQTNDILFLSEDVFALLRESREGVSRVGKIVQDLKDFSHIGAADEWSWADLHAGLESTINIVNNEIKYKAQLVKEYGVLPEIECLPSQLNQVFMNMLVNAAQAIEGQGTITVRSGIGDADEAWIEVSDTGKGISPEHLSRIFDPFFTTKPVGKGTGLGLALSYGIIQKHSGRIDVQSEVGRGTTFRISLPVHQQARLKTQEKALT
jgi:two-component system NtrC family sensor kinase